MIRLYIIRAVLIAAVASTCYWLGGECSLGLAILIWAGVTTGACALGAALLRTSRVGEITWRNRAAGYLIPWGWRLSRGRLWVAAVFSWVTWMAVGGAAFAMRPGAMTEPSTTGVRAALFAAWVIDAAALVYVLGTIWQATPGSRVRSLWKLVTVITAVLGASVGLYVTGRPTEALMFGGGPPLAVGGGMGLFVLTVLIFGRNTRWN
ncbi:hypothetical protein [Limnoglobus roseus]|uniref:Uncharacterized protein n=1 Tax=Limnoglobus roseus TaxID=2598579 RepID=A0A5C1AAG7_9BACT|nr:hypothetical protein [Limnoglobus roseus]QEL16379.1 hypothetical protein PX52LOC_03329 [Limnoglobus roseus]